MCCIAITSGRLAPRSVIYIWAWLLGRKHAEPSSTENQWFRPWSQENRVGHYSGSYRKDARPVREDSARPDVILERSRDAQDLVDGPRAALDRDDEEVAGHAGAARLRSHGREGEASGHIAVGEAGELESPAVGTDDEDLLLMAVGHEERAARADTERGHDRTSVDHLGHALRRDADDLARALLVWRLGAAVAADPHVVPLVDGEKSRPRDRDELGIEHAAVGVEADDGVFPAVGDVEVARRVDGRRFGLSQNRPRATLRGAPGKELGAPVDDAVERADLSLAIEGRDEQLAAAPDRADLRVEQRGPVEVAALDVGAQPRTAHRNPVDGPEVVGLPADVTPSGTGQIEEAGLIESDRGCGRDAADAARGVGVEALARHVDLRGEARWQLELGGRRRRQQHQEQGHESPRHRDGRFQTSRSCISRI